MNIGLEDRVVGDIRSARPAVVEIHSYCMNGLRWKVGELSWVSSVNLRKKFLFPNPPCERACPAVSAWVGHSSGMGKGSEIFLRAAPWQFATSGPDTEDSRRGVTPAAASASSRLPCIRPAPSAWRQDRGCCGRPCGTGCAGDP